MDGDDSLGSARFRTDTIEKPMLSRVIIGYNIKMFPSINLLFKCHEKLLLLSREVFGYQNNMPLPDLSVLLRYIGEILLVE
ncbi:unnamed protein product [Rhizophagus irregularis]|nr:unnamed protein product [Rhizophagus irregularis]